MQGDFKFRRSRRGGVPVDTLLVIEGGLPGWQDKLSAQLEAHRKQAMEKTLTTGTIRGEFKLRPNLADEDTDTQHGFTMLGGLPDWRHREEHLAEAQKQYEDEKAQQAALQEKFDELHGDPSPDEPVVITGSQQDKKPDSQEG